MRISCEALRSLVFLSEEASVERIWEGLRVSCAWATLRRDALSAVMLHKMRRPALQIPIPKTAQAPQPLVLAAMHETHVLARLVASVTVPRDTGKSTTPRDSVDGMLTVHRSPGNKNAMWSHKQNRGSTGSMTDVMIEDDKRLAFLSSLPPLACMPSSFVLDGKPEEKSPPQPLSDSGSTPEDPLAHYGAGYLKTSKDEQKTHESKRNFAQVCQRC